MNFSSAVLFFLALLYLNDSLTAYITHLLSERIMPYRKVFSLQIPAVLIQGIAYSALMLIDDSPNTLINYILAAVFYASEAVILVSWVYFLFRDTDRKKRIFYVSAIFPFSILANFGMNRLYHVITPEFMGRPLGVIGGFLDGAFLHYPSAFIVYGCVAANIWLASKKNIWRKPQAFEEYPKLYIPMGTFCFLIYIIFSIFSKLPLNLWDVVGTNLAYLALLIVGVLMVGDIKRTESVTATQNLLLQQQNYINKLESIQREIRSIQHDYKNMLSGLYAQASEGNAEAVKEYIDTKLLKVDETVREDLRQMNQLTRIELPALKGLIMTKMLEAERDEISFRLEVMLPVSRTSMATEDLLRCVGILLDNAIEEARTHKDAAVTLLLLQEAGALTIVVKNPMRDKPDLARIWNEGYSTKGPGRGVGLANYQNIIRKYPTVTQETKIEREHFVQVLVLAGNR